MHFSRVIGQGWVGLTLCGLLTVGAFVGGYWEGQHALLSKGSATQASALGLHQIIAGHPFPSALVSTTGSLEMAQFHQDQVKWVSNLAQMHGTNGAPNNPHVFAQTQPQQVWNPLAGPPPLKIPSNATPQQRAFPTARDQLMPDQIAFINQHKNDDPAARGAAMQQWRQQNSDRFKQVQQMSQALAQNNSINPTTNSSSVHP